MTPAPRIITAVTPDRRVPGNVVVEVGRVRFASLPADAVSALDLETDLELDDARFEKLTRVAAVEAANRVALRLLAARPRSVNEMLRKLRLRGHNPSAAAEAVGRLESSGLLNDAEFARHFASVKAARGHGPPRILSDLLSRGVERRLAERAIDEVLTNEGMDPTHEARALAERRAAQLAELPVRARRRRLLAYLSRRGYQGHEVREMVEEVVGRSA